MAEEIKLPNLGDGIESGDVLSVFVSVGDVVKAEQGILELETDKATVEVPTPTAGTVTKILVNPGDSIAIGQVILEIETGAAAPAETATPAAVAPAPPEPEPAAAPVVQATPTPVAPAPIPAPVPTPPAVAATPATPSTDLEVAAGPAVRRFAREVGVDLATVTGTGPNGRITRDDVVQAVRQASTASQQAKAAIHLPENAITPPGSEARDDAGPIRIERMTKMRKTIAAKMHESWSTVPRVTNFDDADVTQLDRLRKKSKEDYAKAGVKLTTMPFLIKAVALSLRAHPIMNAVIDGENNAILYKEYINVGIAIDTERGLVVPPLRNADQQSIPELAKDLAGTVEMIRTGKFGISDLRDGTFTISNLGAIGGTYSTPIVNTPEVAILLVGRSRKMPVVVDDEIVIRLMMPLSLSYDHRIVDGADAARFLNEVKGYLEAPSRLLLAP